MKKNILLILLIGLFSTGCLAPFHSKSGAGKAGEFILRGTAAFATFGGSEIAMKMQYEHDRAEELEKQLKKEASE